MTTGARRRPVKTARILGAVDSPVKTPSQGSPMLLVSSRFVTLGPNIWVFMLPLKILFASLCF